MKFLNITASVFAVLALSAGAAQAASASDSKGYLVGSVGYFDITQGDDTAAQFGLEYRHSAWQYGIRPTIGFHVSSDSSLYGYAGIHWDVPLIDNQLYIIPNFVAGAYKEGDGKDLGGTIEFTSGIELAYQFNNAHRLGVAFNHISNASIYDRNPGAETVKVSYSIPTGSRW